MSQSPPIPPSGIDWNNFFNIVATIGLLGMAIVVSAIVFFVLKYRHKIGKPQQPLEPTAGRSRARELVIIATVVLVLLLILAIFSFRMTAYLEYPSNVSEALTIDVRAFQWGFQFIYPNNVSVISECRVPANRLIIFNVTSSDLMHNFGLPDFKVKIDAIPGRYNILAITTPSVEGNDTLNYQIRCYELCGSGHTYMIGTLMVLDPNTFDQWLTQAANSTGG